MLCAGCPEPLSDERAADSLYCSDECAARYAARQEAAERGEFTSGADGLFKPVAGQVNWQARDEHLRNLDLGHLTTGVAGNLYGVTPRAARKKRF